MRPSIPPAVRIVLLGIGLPLAPPLAAQGDPAAELRRELDALRADYEHRIQQLEDRIAELERRPPAAAPRPAPPRQAPRAAAARPAAAPRQDAAPPAPAAAVADPLQPLRDRADAGFRGDTEIRDITTRPDFERLLDQRARDILTGYLDITGYFRAGYGRSDAGGPLRAFGIPGVPKYRLGNEAENYGELAFAKTFFFADTPGHPGGDAALRGPVAHANVRLAFYNPYDNYGSAADTGVSVPEVWASIANVIPAAPEARFWAGSRFYRRHDIHIDDFYFWDMSGGGAGVEDLPLGSGKFAAAWIGDGAESAIYSRIGTPDPLNVAGFSKTNIDFRWYDWPLLGGTGELGLTWARANSGVDAAGR